MAKKVSKKFRCGMVSIVGRPSVGKSTLLNTIVGEKITIVSNVPQTTRVRVRGIYTDERGQIIFIDTPGLHLGKDKLDELLRKSAYGSLSDADCVIHVVDTSEPTGKEEETVVSRLKTLQVPVILALNKIDLKGKYLPQYIELWEKAKGCAISDMKNFVLLPISGRKDTNIDKLIEILFQFLPEGPALYPPDTVSDLPQKIVVGDIIREKFLFVLREELPHAIAVHIESITPRRKNLTHISAVIFVDRESQKEIVIGKNGQLLKKVGILARQELERLLETKVFLDLHVKCQENWRDNPSFLSELGYDIL